MKAALPPKPDETTQWGAITPMRTPIRPQLYGPEDFRNKKRIGSKGTRRAPRPTLVAKSNADVPLTGRRISKHDVRSADVILGRTSLAGKSMTTILDDWWEIYAAASHSKKRDVCDQAIDDLYTRGARFLHKIDDATEGWCFVEVPKNSSKVMQKMLRALRRKVVVQTDHFSPDEKYDFNNKMGEPEEKESTDLDETQSESSEVVSKPYSDAPRRGAYGKLTLRSLLLPTPPVFSETFSSLDSRSISLLASPIPSATNWSTSDVYNLKAHKSVSPDTVYPPVLEQTRSGNVSDDDWPSFPFRQHDQARLPVLRMQSSSAFEFSRVFDEDPTPAPETSPLLPSQSSTFDWYHTNSQFNDVNLIEDSPFSRRFSSMDDDPIPLSSTQPNAFLAPGSPVTFNQRRYSLDLAVFDEPLTWATVFPHGCPLSPSVQADVMYTGGGDCYSGQNTQAMQQSSLNETEPDTLVSPSTSPRGEKRTLAGLFDEKTASEYFALRDELTEALSKLECHEKIVNDWEVHSSVWGHVYLAESDFAQQPAHNPTIRRSHRNRRRARPRKQW